MHVPRPYPKPQPKPKKSPKPIKKTKALMDNFNKTLFIQTRGPLCACGCGEHMRDNVMDAHHALFPRSIKYPQLNDWENLVLVTHYEHIVERKFNTLEWRKKFYAMQCERYGKDHMVAWLKSLPSKLWSRMTFLSEEDRKLVQNG